MEKRVLIFTVAIFAMSVALVAGGCRGAKDKLVGRYTGELKLPKLDKNDPNTNLIKNFQKMNTKPITLELRADHSYALQLALSVEGRWSSDGKVVTLAPQKMELIDVNDLKLKASRTSNAAKTPPVDTPMVFNISSDTTLLAVDQATSGGWLKFTKDK
jgi:hypothetical protein